MASLSGGAAAEAATSRLVTARCPIHRAGRGGQTSPFPIVGPTGGTCRQAAFGSSATDTTARTSMTPLVRGLRSRRVKKEHGLADRCNKSPRRAVHRHERVRQAQARDRRAGTDASTEIGFFQIVNHGIPQEQVDEAFAMTQRSSRCLTIPSQFPLGKGTNAGWEYKSQVRPSTDTADQKESCHITLPRMSGCGRREANCRVSKRDVRIRAHQLGTGGERACRVSRSSSALRRTSSPSATIRSRLNISALGGRCTTCRWSTPSPRISPAGAPDVYRF